VVIFGNVKHHAKMIEIVLLTISIHQQKCATPTATLQEEEVAQLEEATIRFVTPKNWSHSMSLGLD
jgi:hypothetical protein